MNFRIIANPFVNVYVMNLLFVTLISSALSQTEAGLTGIDYILFYVSMGLLALYKLRFKNYKFGFLEFLFVAFCVYIVLNITISHYVKSAYWGFVGALLALMIPVTNLIYKDIVLSRKDIIYILKATSRISLVLVAGIYVEFILNHGDFSSLRGVKSLFKDGGLASTFINIAITINLALYRITRKKYYLYAVIFYGLTIVMLLYIKSVILLIFIIVFYYFRFSNASRLVKGFIIFAMVATAIGGISSFETLSDKFDKYYKWYYTNNSTEDETPRAALYFVSFEIATDQFPFGSGVGTFGSFPVNKTYNDVYYEYGLNKVYGLQDTLTTSAGPNFLLDTYWSSIIGELGVLGASMFVIFFFTPLYRSMKTEKLTDDGRLFAFVVSCITIVISVESFALSSASQANIILLLGGLCNLLVNYVRHENYKIMSEVNEETEPLILQPVNDENSYR